MTAPKGRTNAPNRCVRVFLAPYEHEWLVAAAKALYPGAPNSGAQSAVSRFIYGPGGCKEDCCGSECQAVKRAPESCRATHGKTGLRCQLATGHYGRHATRDGSTDTGKWKE